MLFNSFEYFIFLPIVLMLNFLLPFKYRIWFLLYSKLYILYVLALGVCGNYYIFRLKLTTLPAYLSTNLTVKERNLSG